MPSPPKFDLPKLPKIPLPSGGIVPRITKMRKVKVVEKEAYKPSITALSFGIKGKPEKIAIRPIPTDKEIRKLERSLKRNINKLRKVLI
jgi:hypothetical protein